ncbi:MAG TPA: aspartyl protease family protein [Candidatus Acidoferrales bacterium]|nr:aspartyl protease family protein [Candidatus Acidoferrales bacterium]
MRSFAIALLAVGAAGAQTAPDAAEQQKALHTVGEFARDYIVRLPDFTCRRVTRHLRRKSGAADWQFQVKVAQELSYYGHEEHYQIVEVNDAPKKKLPLAVIGEGFVSTNGNFGWILAQLFDPATQPAFQWKGWETLRDRQAYVFAYRVALANSQAQSSRCVSWVLFQNCKSVTYGYHGLLYIERDSPRVMRITLEPEDVPVSHSPGSESVDYERVTVAGAEYLLPVADTYETNTGKILFRNESVYEDYRKFTAESSMTTTMEPVTSAPPVKAAPPATTSRAAEKPMEAAHYFALRDAVVKGSVPLIARGAVAAAFNDLRQAELDLGAVIKAAPDSEAATMAGGLLAAVYARNGRMKQALAQLERPAGPAPSPEWKDSRDRLAILARYPEQSVAVRGYARLDYANRHDSLQVRLAINGKPAEFTLDTGASLSVISESRARALGIAIHQETFSMSDAVGRKLGCRAGTAAELEAGSFRLRNVPFCVLPDNQPGFVAEPESPPAILGLPVMMAFGTMRWDKAGNFEIGFASKRPKLPESNICFDSSLLLVEATVQQRRLSFVLDTGNPTTMLFSSFAEEGASAARKRQKQGFQSLGEPVEVEAAELRDLQFRVGGKDLVLPSVPLLLEQIESECVNCSGSAGMDLLALARRVTLDFGAMRLILER